MALDNRARGSLEQSIEHVIEDIPFFVKLFRNDEAKKSYQYKNPEDFVLGLTIGRITYSFETSFRYENSGGLAPEEMLELRRTIYLRMGQIRSALADAG
jgi:hypothetical protein